MYLRRAHAHPQSINKAEHFIFSFCVCRSEWVFFSSLPIRFPFCCSPLTWNTQCNSIWKFEQINKPPNLQKEKKRLKDASERKIDLNKKKTNRVISCRSGWVVLRSVYRLQWFDFHIKITAPFPKLIPFLSFLRFFFCVCLFSYSILRCAIVHSSLRSWRIKGTHTHTFPEKRNRSRVTYVHFYNLRLRRTETNRWRSSRKTNLIEHQLFTFGMHFINKSYQPSSCLDSNIENE